MAMKAMLVTAVLFAFLLSSIDGGATDGVMKDIHDLQEVLLDLEDLTKQENDASEEGESIAVVDEREHTEQKIKEYCATHGSCEPQGGDEVVTKEQVALEKEDNEIAANNTHKPQAERDPIKNVAFHWKKPRGSNRVVVPYKLHPAVAGDKQKVAAINEAIRRYKEKSCIDWVPLEKTSDPKQYHVLFINGGGCYSYIGNVKGMIREKGYQPISIGRGCAYVGTVIHEMLHCMGFFHEQSRPDRDQYVKIFLENLSNSGFARNFRKQAASTVDSQGIDYDVGSVMHYGPTFFAKFGKSTILKRVQKGSNRLESFRANRKGFAVSDLKQLNSMYQCQVQPAATSAPPTTTSPEKPSTVLLTTASPTMPSTKPPPPDKTCEIIAKLGLCRYKMVCAECKSECQAVSAKGLVINVYGNNEKCKWWAKKGLCETFSRTRVWMNAFCLKACLDHEYPDDGLCPAT